MKYRQFIFQDYSFDQATKSLALHYAIDDQLFFTETYRFDFGYAPDYSREALERAVQNLFFMAGVSYYKTYLPPELVTRAGQLDAPSAAFFAKTYQRGLGEFFYVNQLDPETPINFPTNCAQLPQPSLQMETGYLAALGGGKDSLVAIEALRGQEKLATWSINHRQQLQPLVARVGLPHFQVDRTWDPQLAALHTQDAYNGHVPISAILGCVGTIVAILSGYRDLVMSNEQSANEATLIYQDVPINHQYSKSSEFERDYQALLSAHFRQGPCYYSLLRPYGELRISELFAASAFGKYQDVFCSCNRAYTIQSERMSWCGQCPKCAFTFLALTPFVVRSELEALFGGKNLLLEPVLAPIYRQLLGIEGDKPLECVGDIAESRAAMRRCQAHYPELQKYQFELPSDYDFRAAGPHRMPPEMYTLVKKFCKQ